MPRGFQFPIRAEKLDMWTTFARLAEVDDPKDTPITAQRGAHFLQSIARLKPGVTLWQADADARSIGLALSREYPDTNSHQSKAANSLLEELVGETKTSLFMLLAAVGLVLLIACANVANLMLARSSSRAREIAIRAALGATRARILRQLITEAVVLSVGGAALGVGVAVWALSAVLQLYPVNLPRAQEIGIDSRVLLFTGGLALLTALVFGLFPAWRLSAPNLSETMREGGRSSTAGRGQNRLRSGLVIAETAWGAMLLIGAGLLLRSWHRLAHVDLGFNPRHVLTASFDLSETRYNPDQQDQFVRNLLDRLKDLPGVIRASGALPLPIGGEDDWRVSFNLIDHPVPKAHQPSAGFYVVAPGFFETMQLPLLRGRTFDQRDQRNAAPVMIITQAFAQKFFPNEDPIGRRIEIGAGEGPARARYKTREIVGVVGDIRTSKLRDQPAAAYYIPLPQLMWGPPTLIIRTAGGAASTIEEARKVLSAMDPEAPLYRARTLEDCLAFDLGRARFQTVLLTLFAAVALLLTAVGLYGVMAYAVAQRTHEIGVRMALGATRSEVLSMILGRGFILVATGLGTGLVGALALARFIEALLYQIPPRDPFTYGGVCLTLTLVALLASYVPARRATRVDPMFALRYE